MDELEETPAAATSHSALFGARPIWIHSRRRVPKFEDDSWDLSPLQQQFHLKAPIVNFRKIPEKFKLNAKEITRAQIQDLPSDGTPLAASTIHTRSFPLQHVFSWLYSNGFTSLDEITPEDLRRYRKTFTEVGEDIPYEVGRVMNALYQHRKLMTRGLRIDPAGFFTRKKPKPRGENATERIPEEVLSPALVWALRCVETFAPDIISAKEEYERLRAQTFKKPRGTGSLTRDAGHRALKALLAEYKAECRPLPGQIVGGRTTVNFAHLAREAWCVMDVVQRIGRDDVMEAVAQLGVDPRMPLRFRPQATLDSEPWMDDIPFWDVELLVNNLVASCYMLIAFFSGMRDNEVKHLRRGCLVTQTFDDERSPRYWVKGIAFKNEQDVAGGGPASWRVGRHAAMAVEVLERLQPPDEDLLFARFDLQVNARPLPAGASVALTANFTIKIMNEFVCWVNDFCAAKRRSDAISLHNGTAWHLTTRQFRRTLAWFIARRPGGSIAGAMQFRHLSVQMFEGYAGTSASGFRAEVEAEDALMRGEYLLAMVDRHEHEELQGPAAEIGRLRMTRFHSAAAPFRGIIVDSPGQMKKLMKANDPAIYSNDLVTCIFDPQRALCLRRAQTDGRPDLQQCDPFQCANVALTTGNVAGWREIVTEIEALLASEHALPPYVASRLKETRDRTISRFLTHEDAQ